VEKRKCNFYTFQTWGFVNWLEYWKMSCWAWSTTTVPCHSPQIGPSPPDQGTSHAKKPNRPPAHGRLRCCCHQTERPPARRFRPTHRFTSHASPRSPYSFVQLLVKAKSGFTFSSFPLVRAPLIEPLCCATPRHHWAESPSRRVSAPRPQG
jgi:hypothetical protein